MDRMTERDPGAPIGSFVALGDSFTEGLNDPYPSGGYRGWADRVAAVLAAQAPGFGYANLAISGKVLGQVIAEQVPRAAELAPDLVSLAAGGNDILRGADVDALASRFERAVVTLQAAGWPGADLHRLRPPHVPGDPAAAGPDRHLRHAPACDRRPPRLRSGGPVVDAGPAGPASLEPGPAAPQLRGASPGRPAHLRGAGRPPLRGRGGRGRRCCGRGRWTGRRGGVAGDRAAGDGAAGDGLAPRPASSRSYPAGRAVWLAARRQDARWARQYAMPWVRRRLARAEQRQPGFQATRPASGGPGRPHPVRSARISVSRSRDAAIQGSAHGSAEASAASRCSSLSP